MKSSRESSSLRSSKIRQEQKVVYKLTKQTYMKFRPQLAQQKPQQTTILSKIKGFSKIFSPQSTKSLLKQSSELTVDERRNQRQKCLKYLFRIDTQNYLIGNEVQLDSINISLLDDYVETELLWSFKLEFPIQKILVHDRKRNIIVITNGEFRIYEFEGRKSKNTPRLVKAFKLIDEAKLIQFAQESTVAIFFENYISTFIIDGMKSRQKGKVEYKIQKDLSIFQITESIDRIINIYFTKDHQTQKGQDKQFLELWCLAIEFRDEKLVVPQEMKMIYIIQAKYKQSLKIFALAKDCCIMNISHAILLFKNNYYIDRVKINLQSQYSYLQLFNQKTIGLVCQTQIDFYELITDLVSNPPKISVKSFDSIRRESFDSNFKYLNGLKLQEHKYVFFYQIPQANLNGQINYQFYITQKWNFQDKINSILPTITKFSGDLMGSEAKSLMDDIQVCWDVLNKIGLSRKDAYLRIWKQSKKQSIEQYNLLLDTHDYMTIREEIELKLKKKSMLLIEVLKIQLGCLNMIQQNVFSIKYTADEFKNYLISHYFIRKMESFKELRIWQKQTGKLRITASNQKDFKFFINIQEYTTTKESDLKQQLLEMIIDLCKHKKDIATEIRMVIKKFKFSFRIVYEDMFKDIIRAAQNQVLYLLQTIPEILPFQYPPNIQFDRPQLYQGVWGTLTEQQWQKGMYLQNVSTIYNKERVFQQKNNLWIKRNWLKYHDMVFLTRKQILQEYDKIKTDKLFYNLVSTVFMTYKDNGTIDSLMNYIQDTYIQFPHHLYSNINLYYELYLYFKANSKSTETFDLFMTKKDEQIMKQIFQHQKAKKGSLLKEVKIIYQKLNQNSKFNRSLLKYFSSNLSQASDIKYLLNRINNEKKEFHAENEQMYEVLIKGMEIKLKLGSEKDIPIQQILIYIQNLPLKEQNPIVKELQILKRISQKGEKLKKIKLNMNVFEIIRMMQVVLYNIIGFQIEDSGIRKDRNSQTIIATSQKILYQIREIRQKIYGKYEDNINLFIFLIKILETIEMVPFVFDIIQNNKDKNIPFDNGQIQNAVYYLYKRAVSNNSVYKETNEYIQQLITILPQDNDLRVFIQSQYELASIFNEEKEKVIYPISGQTGVLTMLELTAIIKSLDRNALVTLNIKRIFQLSSCMQRIMIGTSEIYQFNIYQVYCIALLKFGKLKEAIDVIKILIGLKPDSATNIIYPITIFRYIFAELIEENKGLMSKTIALLIDQPLELLQLYTVLLSNSYSNQDQKRLLNDTIQSKLSQCIRFNHENILFDDDVASFMKENPQKNEQFNALFQHYYHQLLHYEQGFNKNADVFLIYLLILKDPLLVIKYISFLRYQINLKMFRGLLSFLSKFQVFDALRVLDFGKKIFKILFDLQRNSFNPDNLASEILINHQQEINLLTIANNTPNLIILAMSVQRFKTKIKQRHNIQARARSHKKMSENQSTKDIKLTKVHELLQGTSKQMTFEYGYHDSDDVVLKIQKLTERKIVKVQVKEFYVNKFLSWLFDRKNQLIQYYLLKGNELQAQESLKNHEQKLKFSFTKTFNNAPMKDNAVTILKILESNKQPLKAGGSKGNMSNLFQSIMPMSDIPVVVESEIHEPELWQFASSASKMVNSITILKEELIKSLSFQDDKISYNNSLLHDLEKNHELERTLPLLFKEIYYESSIDLQKALALIRQTYMKNSKMIFMNLEFIEIYLKIDQLANRLHISLESRSLLPIQGLFIKEKQPFHLFNFIKPSLFTYLNQNNVHTLSRIISLSFKKPQFQQDLNSEFLKNIITEYEQLDGSNLLDENLKLQKIMAFLYSMQISHLKMQTPKTINQMKNNDKKKKVIGLISDALRKKNDMKSAEQFQAKFIEVQ